ncbi:MAG: S8 family serine peptidase [Candidatus Deferrimicrobiaceae bacterium]
MRLRKISLCLFAMWGVASLSGMEVAPDLRKIDPLALVSEEPAIVAAQTRVAGVRERKPLPVFVHLRSGNQVFPGKIRSLGGEAVKVHARLYTGAIPRDAARYVSLWPEVAYIEADRLAYPMLDFSGPAISADTVHTGSLAWPSPFDNGVTGAGVFVGVVDSGLSGAHPDFHTAGQETPLRVPHTYVSPQLPVSQSDPLADEDGHGTHVTGIAAGNGFASSGTYTGMAPDADILVGKTSFFVSDIVTAVSDLLTFAGNTPVAVNLSLGSPMGPHDGTSGFESGIDFLAAGPAGSKRIVAVSAGNERDKDEHFQATLPPFGVTTATVIFAGLLSTSVEIWADGDDRYTVTATMGSETVSVPSGSSGSSAGGGITVSNSVSQPPNGATLISVFFLPVSSGGTASIQLQRTRNGGSGKVDAYINNVDGTFGTSTSTETGTITEPANGSNVLAVGSFNTKIGGGAGPVGDISDFSSLGLTRDGRIKPDLTAPGSLIYSARSLEASFAPIEIAPNDNYVILQGTSMAAPHVTGIAALVWQTNPALTGTQMRERLRRTADPPTDGSQTPNNTWGTGKVNALQAVTESVASINAPASSLPGTPVSLTSENSSGPFGAPITNYQWAAPGASVSPPNLDNATFQANAPDDYTVSLTITAGGVTSLPASKIIHVNTLPVAVIDGPASDNTGLPVTFTGSGSSDPDGQGLAFRWVLVTRPATSSATLLPAGADNATMTADVVGLYEIGLRVDDGLDNSALVTKSYTALSGSVSGSSNGGGGGCVIGIRNSEEDGASSLAALLLLLGPLGLLAARRREYRFSLHRGSTTPSPRR